MSSSSGHLPARLVIAVALIGFSGAWNAGNVGPVASEIAGEFDVSLAVIGILSGTLFLGATVIGLMFAAQIGERTGVVRGLRLACVGLIAGNLVFAVSPWFAGLAVGRILPGLAFALINALGAVWARQAGGVRLIGVFGASIQLGIAGALVLGSVLSDLSVDWRVGFVISAALALVALVAIPGSTSTAGPQPHRAGFLRLARRHARVYRLALLFISLYGVPMVLSAWLIEYLRLEGGVATALAGGFAFVLFGVSAAVRLLGAHLQDRGVPHAALGGALGLAAIGMAALAIDPVAGVAIVSIVALGFGFGVPYATMLTEAQELFPEAPSEPVALMTLLGLTPAVIVIPVVGHALSRGDGGIALGLLAVFVAIATVANLRRSGTPLREVEAAPD